MIIVTGGTGNVGRELVAMLKISGLPFKVLTRDRKRAHAVLGKEVSCVTGDLHKPATLKAALGGADRLFLISPLDGKMDRHQAETIKIAKLVGVGHIVLVSGPDSLMTQSVASRFGQKHWAIEEALIASGIAFTILRPSYFMQNIARDNLDNIKQRRLIRGSIDGRAPIHMIDARDVSATAYCALTYSGHRNLTYTLTGMPITMRGCAEVFTQALEEVTDYEQVAGARAAVGKSGGGEGGFAASVARDFATVFDLGYGDYHVPTVQEVTGYAPRTFAEYVTDFRMQFI